MELCPKCGFERNPKDTDCPRCGIIYARYEAQIIQKRAEEKEKRKIEELRKQEAEEKRKRQKTRKEIANSVKSFLGKNKKKTFGALGGLAISVILVVVCFFFLSTMNISGGAWITKGGGHSDVLRGLTIYVLKYQTS